MHPLRAAALYALELVGVQEELEDVAGLRVTAELRVGDLVGPGAEIGRLLDADQEVREPEPPVTREAPLMEDAAALTHRRDRASRAFVWTRVLILERDHVEAIAHEPADYSILMAIAALE
jgi:hypothetical protein